MSNPPPPNSDINRYELFIEEQQGKKPKRFLRKKLNSSDFGKTFTHKVYLDFIQDGVPKQVYGTIDVKVGDIIPINKPPIIDITTQTIIVKPDEKVKLIAVITDPEQAPLNVVWELTGESVVFQKGNEGNQYWVEFVAPSVDTELNFKVTAIDDKGASVSKTINVKVRKEPIPEPTIKLKIGHCGDTHGDHKAVEMMKTREQCNFILHSGDVTDTESDDDGYIDTIKNLGLTYGKDVANSQGNHSSPEEGGEGAQEDLETAFPILKEKRWLQFYQVSNVAIIINNTQISGYSQTDSVAFKHVKDSLAQARQLRLEGKIDWIIFMQHKPIYVMAGGHDPEYNFRYNAHPLFDEYGVDIWVSGHVHNKQRTLPLLFGGVGTNIPPKVNDKMKGDAHDFTEIPHGIICCQNGSASKSHNLEEGLNSWTAWSEDSGNGYTIFEIDGKNLTGKFVEIDSGEIRHTFKVTKGDVEPEPDKPVLVFNTPKTVEPQATGTLDASQTRNADNVIISSVESLPLGNTEHDWKKTFVAPNQENINLRFDAIARKGTFTDQKQVSIEVKKSIPVEGEIDHYGIEWKVAKGNQTLIVMSRDEATDDRWSGNVDGLQRGFEATFIGKSIGTNSSSHFAMKQGGSNHSKGNWQDERWLDTGIRYDGTIQLQYEGPHPNNHDFTLPDKCWFIKKLSKGLEGNWIGLKWLQEILKEGGSPADGGVRWRMWVNEDPLDVNGKVKNENWKLAYDFIDGIDVQVIQPQTFIMQGTMDCEVRRSDTKQHDVFGDGKIYTNAQDGTPALHVRAFGTATTTRIDKLQVSEGHPLEIKATVTNTNNNKTKKKK